MEIPSHIAEQIKRIHESKSNWTYQFNATWGLAKQLRERYENKDGYEQPIDLPLPASKEGEIIYPSVRKVVEIAESRDPEITMTHAITIFSFLEALVEDVYYELRGKTKTFTRIETLLEFLKNEKLLLPEEESMFIMAKKSRDCYAHYGDRISPWWRDAYREHEHVIKEINPAEPKVKLSPIVNYHVVEAWHDLLLRITDRIEKLLIER